MGGRHIQRRPRPLELLVDVDVKNRHLLHAHAHDLLPEQRLLGDPRVGEQGDGLGDGVRSRSGMGVYRRLQRDGLLRVAGCVCFCFVSMHA